MRLSALAKKETATLLVILIISNVYHLDLSPIQPEVLYFHFFSQ